MPPTKFLGTPYLQDPDLTIWNGDGREVLRDLPDESVQMCVTSPPYWGLRDYGSEGQLGLEPTPEAYVEKMVEVFREVRRVLRKDGVLFLNLGDSYATGQASDSRSAEERSKTLTLGPNRDGLGEKNAAHVARSFEPRKLNTGLKPKDLVLMPARVALALQADGWYLRSEITWCKPNPMPESVTDRPTQATEKVYLFSKLARYFYDAEAVRETADWQRENHAERWNEARRSRVQQYGAGNRHAESGGFENWQPSMGRNLRNWWEIATEPYPEAHFATYPQELVRRCILAGSSERGCCPECGAPWVREVEKGEPVLNAWSAKGAAQYDDEIGGMAPRSLEEGSTLKHIVPTTTLGWRPTCHILASCRHQREPVPCTILDPFFGSGTSGLVARKHGRKTIGIELSPEYCALAARRLSQLSLLAEGAA